MNLLWKLFSRNIKVTGERKFWHAFGETITVVLSIVNRITKVIDAIWSCVAPDTYYYIHSNWDMNFAIKGCGVDVGNVL